MPTIAERISQNAPRFKKQDAEVIYKLFDAFLKTTLLDNRAIDFSQEPVQTPDGIIEFVPRDESFSDLVKHYASVNEAIAKEKAEDQEPKTTIDEPYAVAGAHFYWLWTLAMNNAPTTCGADNLKILKFEESGAAFPGKLGLWNASTSPANKRNDLALIVAVLTQFATWSKKPAFANVDELKAEFLKFVLKTRRTLSAGIRHGLMHLCDPNLYVYFCSIDDKMTVIKQHSLFIESFHQTPVKYRFTSYFEDTHKGYYAEFSDEQVAHIFDALAALPSNTGMEYGAFMESFFDGPAKKAAKKTPKKAKKS